MRWPGGGGIVLPVELRSGFGGGGGAGFSSVTGGAADAAAAGATGSGGARGRRGGSGCRCRCRCGRCRDPSGGTHDPVDRARRLRLGHRDGCSRVGLGGRLGLGGLGLAPAPRARGRGRLRLGLLDDGLTAQVAAVGQPPDAIRGRIVDARRMALHPDLELFGEVQDYLVVNAELSGELVDPDLLRGQSQFRPLLRCGSVQSRTESLDVGVRQGGAKRPFERLAPDRLVEAGRRAGAHPGSATRLPPADFQTPVRSPGDPIELRRRGLPAAPDAAALGFCAN